MRITMNDLRSIANRITDKTGKKYVIEQAYGAYRLDQVLNDSYAQIDVLGMGLMPKRELYTRLNCYLLGLESAS